MKTVKRNPSPLLLGGLSAWGKLPRPTAPDVLTGAEL